MKQSGLNERCAVLTILRRLLSQHPHQRLISFSPPRHRLQYPAGKAFPSLRPGSRKRKASCFSIPGMGKTKFLRRILLLLYIRIYILYCVIYYCIYIYMLLYRHVLLQILGSRAASSIESAQSFRFGVALSQWAACFAEARLWVPGFRLSGLHTKCNII